jgi:hypothetical protein
LSRSFVAPRPLHGVERRPLLVPAGPPCQRATPRIDGRPTTKTRGWVNQTRVLSHELCQYIRGQSGMAAQPTGAHILMDPLRGRTRSKIWRKNGDRCRGAAHSAKSR